MDTVIRSLGYRQFMWGLSNGVAVLAVAGYFWWSMAVWPTNRLLLVAVTLVAAGLGYGALRLRRRATGFRLREANEGGALHRERTRKTRVGFRWASVAQMTMVSLAMLLSSLADRDDLLWPGIALAVSLHFIPIAYVVRIRAYYVTAAFGVFVASVLLVVPRAVMSPTSRLVVLGAGMGVVVWTTATYLLLHAERLALVWDDAAESRQ